MKRISILFFVLAIAITARAQTNIYKWLQLKNAGASDTAAVDGKFWYDPNVKRFSFVENGAVKHFSTASSLPALSPGYIYVGNVSSVATPQAVSGDGLLSNAGALTITGLRSKVLPLLAAGFLKYTGSAWTFDNSTYLTSYTETDPIVKAINGLIKSNGTTISAAVSGTDYLAPFGSQTAKFFYAAPNGSSGTPSFRGIAASDIPTLNQNTTGSAATWATARTISITGDVGYTSGSLDGSANVSGTGTLATVNSNVGSFGSSTQVATFTVNGKGLITAAANTTIAAWLTGSGGTLTAPNTITGSATNTLKFLFPNLGTTVTDGAGIWLSNNTAAAAGAQQISPILTFELQGWKTNSTAASQQGLWQVYGLPIQGTANPTSQLIFQSSINGSATNGKFILASDGAQITSQPNGLKILTNAAAIGGITLNNTAASSNTINVSNGFFLTNSIGVSSAQTIMTISPGTTINQTSGTVIGLQTTGIFNPTSGSGVFDAAQYNPTINQTGGANGAVSILLVNPIYTAAGGNVVDVEIFPSITSITGTHKSIWAHSGVAQFDAGILGVATNSSATAGNVGEAISSLVASGSAVSLTTATPSNITSISLTAGDWDVEGIVNYSETTSTVTARTAGITSTSVTIPTDGSEGYNGIQSTVTTEKNSIALAPKRFSLSGTTTVYLIGQATFSAGTCSAFGSISARRVR